MQYQVTLDKPVPVAPKVQKIVLELSPEEFLSIYRHVMNNPADASRNAAHATEGKHSIRPSFSINYELENAARAAGILKEPS